ISVAANHGSLRSPWTNDTIICRLHARSMRGAQTRLRRHFPLGIDLRQEPAEAAPYGGASTRPMLWWRVDATDAAAVARRAFAARSIGNEDGGITGESHGGAGRLFRAIVAAAHDAERPLVRIGAGGGRTPDRRGRGRWHASHG